MSPMAVEPNLELKVSNNNGATPVAAAAPASCCVYTPPTSPGEIDRDPKKVKTFSKKVEQRIQIQLTNNPRYHNLRSNA
jgi:hypothetical protein